MEILKAASNLKGEKQGTGAAGLGMVMGTEGAGLGVNMWGMLRL